MVVNVLLCAAHRHNRRRTFRTYALLLSAYHFSLLCAATTEDEPSALAPYSLLLAPYPHLLLISVLLCGARSARVFFVAKANEVTDASEARVVAERGDSRKRIPHRVLIL